MNGGVHCFNFPALILATYGLCAVTKLKVAYLPQNPDR